MFRLERMELLGFKSFCERTEVTFPSGVTVVVGPNGCGKSNLGDALSWVLGEQSVRAMRGERMEDVIFGGTDGRRPLGMAEVTLVLSRLGGDGNGDSDARGFPLREAGGASGSENAARDLPLVNSPLVVSRRLFRSGESEYLMNGRRCRLRDIHEVLYGTGLGTRAYTVIEQGKVDTILSGKPRERRLLIEEAAGILGYKARKRAAWLKLEATQSNLLRIQDLVGEVTRHINSVKRQAARARRFRRLQEEARRRTRWLFAHRVSEAERERREGRQALGTLAQQEASVAAQAGRAAAAAEARERQRERVHRELRELDEAMAALGRRHDQQEAAVKHLREQQSAASERAERLDSEATGLREEVAVLEEEAERRGVESRSHTEEAAAAASQAAAAGAEFQAELDGLEAANARAEQERRGLFEILDKITQARARCASLEQNLRAGRMRLDRLALERAQMRREAEEVAQALEALARRRSSLQAEAMQAEETARAGAQSRAQVQEERERSAREGAAIAGRLEALDQYRRSLAQGEAGEPAEAEPDPLPRVADFVEADTEVEAAVEAYADGWLACHVLGPGAAADAWGRLRPNGPRYWIARARSSSPAPQPAGPGVIARLVDRVRAHGPHARAILSQLGGAWLVRDGEAALELAGREPGVDLVGLDGTVVTEQGVAFRKERGAPERGPLGRRRLLREAEEECASLRRAAEEEGARAAALARAAEEAAVREQQAAERKAAGLQELASLVARESEAAIRRQRLSGRERLLQEEGSSLAADLARWEGEAERAREELGVQEDLRRALEASAAAAQTEAEERQRAIKELHARLEEVRARQAEAERLRAVHSQRAEAVQRRAVDLAERSGGLEGEARACRQSARDLAERRAEAEAALASVLEESSRTREARSRQEQKAEELRQAAEAGQQEIRRLQQELEAAHAAARDREVALARADSDWEHLAHECRQEIDLSLEQVRPAEGEALPERDTCERELGDVRQELARLGPVNLLALEEYQELDQRQRFLSAQQEDLQRSVDSLKQTIQRLNRRSREQFLEAFEEIRRHFHELFRVLFGGGRAELRLEEGEDVLECGLEVNAQPPGKHLQSIQLLSGGEKALAALALLFSIFRYKPSPFCLLDEVDAALDESNVERFLRILRDFQSRTQFVLITHNKRSMEIADLLYGVTMEEPGVSKLVSVSLA